MNITRLTLRHLPRTTKRCGLRFELVVVTLLMCLATPYAFANTASKLHFNGGTDSTWYFQSIVASSSDTDFHDAVVTLDYEQSQEHSYISAVSVGKKVSDYMAVWPFDVVAYLSFQQFNERGNQPNAWGTTLYAKAYHSFNLPKVNLPLRVGFAQGLSYVSRIPLAEVRDFKPYVSEKLVYYMEYSLQTSLRALLRRGNYSFHESFEDIYVGYTVWHRSTFFGLFGESTGGINYLGLSMEAVLR